VSPAPYQSRHAIGDRYRAVSVGSIVRALAEIVAVIAVDAIRLAARHPDLKALFIWGIEPIPNRGDPDREDFVSKPFSGHELLSCVFELLPRNRNDRERIVNALRVE
jgi:hypothetical protein